MAADPKNVGQVEGGAVKTREKSRDPEPGERISVLVWPEAARDSRSRRAGWHLSALGCFVFLGVSFCTADAAAQNEPPSVEPSAGPSVEPSAGPSVEPSAESSTAAATPAGAAGALSGQEEASLPWSSVGKGGEAPLPAFLQVTEARVADDRPSPTSEQVAALRALEAEVEGFKRAGATYRDMIAAIVRREYLRQRRVRDESFGRQITDEEGLQDDAMESAIVQFERFIEAYPADPTYTPDAMFRLGELYFERSALAFRAQLESVMDARDRGEEPEEPEKNFGPTIDLFRRLIRDFPDYQRIDGVYYLVGYCFNEMAQSEEARLAWLNLVCANEYSFNEGVQRPGTPELDRSDALAADFPAVDLPGTGGASGRAKLGDAYAGCKPAVASSRFRNETWLRIGEYHFDYDVSSEGMARAISAYRRVLQQPEDRNYNLALYKVAWSYYRAFRYPEAVKYFAELVQWSDEARKRTGKAGSELRSEAIQYIAIAFAYDDWNENQTPDPIEGLPDGITRVQDPGLLSQDTGWTAEVYQQLGQVYFDEAKYPEAIEVWKLALKRWPFSPKAPSIQSLVARAHVRANEMERAMEARGELARYTEGTQWWNNNVEYPVEQREAERMAEDALINAAVFHHQQAQRMRRLGVQESDIEQLRRAQEQYGLAARAYRKYVETYPNSPQAYELKYNLADALFWSESYEEAAQQYSSVRDSNLDDRFLSESARRVVESLRRLFDSGLQSGSIAARDDPPSPKGEPARVSPVEMPKLLQRLAHARELYLARVTPEQDTEKVRDSYWFNNTLLLYRYGYWPPARDRFQKIFESRCVGASADATGRTAWLNLRDMAVALGDQEEVSRLGQDLQSRGCTFVAGETEAPPVNCKDPANREEPQCLAGADLTNIQYQKAVQLFGQAEKASGEVQVQLYEQSASLLVQAVDKEPDHPQAPLALEKAAIALERTSRFESAAGLYERIIRDVGPLKAETDERQVELDGILGNAYFRLAFNANRFFDFNRAVRNYLELANSQRFARSKDPDMAERREGALINAAKIMEYDQRYSEAARYYERAAGTLKVPAERMAAYYRVAEMAYKRRSWAETVREMRRFIDRYGDDPAAGEMVVQARWRIAEARKAQGNQREYRSALSSVVSAFAASGQAAGSFAAEYAAQAKFILVDDGVEAFEKFKVTAKKPPSLKAYVDGVSAQIDSGAREATQRNEAYDAVSVYRRPSWSVAALVRKGRIYEILAKAVLDTPFVVPTDMKKQMAKLPDYAREDIQIQIEERIRQLLDDKVRPIECFAVANYALAARAARVGAIDNEFTQQAIARLNAYGDERIGECIAERQAQDASFGGYQPGEFTRAPRGVLLPMPSGVATPGLSTEVE